MPQVTTPPVTVIYSSVKVTLRSIPTFMELAAASGQHDVVQLSALIPRDTTMDVINLITNPQQQSQAQMPSQAYSNYVMDPPQADFSF